MSSVVHPSRMFWDFRVRCATFRVDVVFRPSSSTGLLNRTLRVVSSSVQDTTTEAYWPSWSSCTSSVCCTLLDLLPLAFPWPFGLRSSLLPRSAWARCVVLCWNGHLLPSSHLPFSHLWHTPGVLLSSLLCDLPPRIAALGPVALGLSTFWWSLAFTAFAFYVLFSVTFQ